MNTMNMMFKNSMSRNAWNSDSDMDIEVRECENNQTNMKGKKLALMSLSALGIVYGDIGTSPLYVFSSVFGDKEKPSDNYILGVFSTVFWTITTMVLVKYVLITMRADDHGEGGIFALYSIIKRTLMEEKASDFGIEGVQTMHISEDVNVGNEPEKKSNLKTFLKKYKFMRQFLLFIVIVCASLILSDGILTPAISVVSAMEGIEFNTGISQTIVIICSICILVVLFFIQSFGTKKIGPAFGPIMLIWFITNLALGVYNIIIFDVSVFKGLSPHYMYYYWSENGFLSAWKTLGSIMLSITGAEALYADMGHLNVASIRISFVSIVYPSLVFTYLGQTAMVLSDYTSSSTAYWSSVPSTLTWPVVVIATLATVIASQALITGTFTIVQQAIHLDICPKMLVKQTDKHNMGQVYLPVINWFLFFGSVFVIIIFKSSLRIGEAYGFAVSAVLFLDTFLVTIVMLITWKSNTMLSMLFMVFFGIISGLFLGSNAIKIPTGAWFSLVISIIVTSICSLWHRGQRMKMAYVKNNKVQIGEIFKIHTNNTNNIVYYNELSEGVVPAYKKFVDMIPLVGPTNIILTVRKVPIPTVSEEQRFLVKFDIHGFYHVICRYGYTDTVDHGTNFIRSLCKTVNATTSDVIFVVGKPLIIPRENSCFFRRILINVYTMLSFISRRATGSFNTPREKLLTFEIVYDI